MCIDYSSFVLVELCCCYLFLLESNNTLVKSIIKNCANTVKKHTTKQTAKTAVDDLYGQGYDPASIEGAIQEAVRRIVGPNADETMLSPAQQSVLMALRSQSQAPQPPGLPMEPIDAPMDEPIGEAWYN